MSNIEVALRGLLVKHNLNEHGVVKELAAAAGVSRKTIGALINNKAATLSLAVLGRICEWFREKGVKEDVLSQLLVPGPSALWEAVARLGSVWMYVGTRCETERSGAKRRWVAERDAEVVATILRSLTKPGLVSTPPAFNIEYVRYDLMPTGQPIAYSQIARDAARAQRFFRDKVQKRELHTASIVLGSSRACLLTEYLIAEIFHCSAFSGTGRTPFWLSYRKRSDPWVPSCYGSLGRPPDGKEPADPGVHYLDDNGVWKFLPWVRDKSDAGVVTIRRDARTGACDIAVIGFSGDATEMSGNMLIYESARFWPLYATTRDNRQLGVFVCRFDLEAGRHEVIRISKGVLESCMRLPASRRGTLPRP